VGRGYGPAAPGNSKKSQTGDFLVQKGGRLLSENSLACLRGVVVSWV